VLFTFLIGIETQTNVMPLLKGRVLEDILVYKEMVIQKKKLAILLHI